MRVDRCRTATVVVLAVAVLAGSACSGPRRPIEVTMKELPGDVAIGRKKLQETSATTAPSGLNAEPVAFPPFLQPPPRLQPFAGEPPTPPTSEAAAPKPAICGTAGRFDSPRREAPRNVTAPPRMQLLPYRNEGTYEVSTQAGETQKGTYPPTSYRSVVPRSLGNGTFEYSVTEGPGGQQTTTTYLVDPASGLYLREVITPRGDGTFDRFHASTDTLRLLPLPASPGGEVNGVAVDPLTRTTMSLVGSVVGKARVDACGTLIDVWRVEITDGRITSPNKQLRFTATYDIGTQYGALSVRDVVSFSCDDAVNTYCDNGRSVKTTNTATVTVEPTTSA